MLKVALVLWTAAAAALLAGPQAASPPAAGLSCEQIETFLKTAKIGAQRDLPVGVTVPSRALLDDGTLRHEAVIQTVDITKTSHPTPTGTELNFRDAWQFNVAGYELAKMLDHLQRGNVVTVTGALAAETLPDSSRALTWNVCVVPGVMLRTTNDVSTPP